MSEKNRLLIQFRKLVTTGEMDITFGEFEDELTHLQALADLVQKDGEPGVLVVVLERLVIENCVCCSNRITEPQPSPKVTLSSFKHCGIEGCVTTEIGQQTLAEARRVMEDTTDDRK